MPYQSVCHCPAGFQKEKGLTENIFPRFLIGESGGFLCKTKFCVAVSSADKHAFHWSIQAGNRPKCHSIAPVVSKWIQGAKVYELEYFLVICFIFWAITFISEITSFPITFTSYFQYFGQGIGSFVLGYYIAIKNSRYTKSKKFGFKLYIVGVLFTYLGAIIIAEMTGKPSTLTNLSPTIAIQTVGLFIILKNINFEKKPKVLNSMAISLSNNSYEFYLIQIPIIWTVTILLRPWNVNPLVKILVMFLTTVLIITLLLKVLKKVPYLNTIVWSR